jgi:predicted XRE-type DNA-binding protein
MDSHARRFVPATSAATHDLDTRDWRPWTRGLGQEVRRLRRDLGLSQQQLAELAGVSQGAVSRLEAGRALKTPLVAVVGVYLALLGTSRRRQRGLLSPEVTAVLDRIARFGSVPNAVPDVAGPPVPDDGPGA